MPPLFEAGWQSFRAGDFAEAEQRFSAALDLVRRNNGEQSRRYSIALYSLGFVYLIRNKLVEAEAAVRSSLVVGESLHDNNHMAMMDGNATLASLLIRLGRPEEGATAAERAIDIGTSAWGTNSVNVSGPFETLARARQAGLIISGVILLLKHRYNIDDRSWRLLARLIFASIYDVDRLGCA